MTGTRTRGGWTLRARLIVLSVAVVTVAAALATVLDYRREYNGQIRDLLDGMEDEAEGLRLMRPRVANDASFEAYLDEFCRQMNEHVSPGHQIIVLDAAGQPTIHTHHHTGPDLTDALAGVTGREGVMRVGDKRVAWVRAQDPSGWAVLVAQFTDPVDETVQSEVRNRELTSLGISALLVVVIWLGVGRWVLRPLELMWHAADAWSRRNFSVRAVPAGPPDVKALAVRFNAMAAEQQHVEGERRAELERARAIQQNLMPAVIPSIPGLSVAALFRPAESVAGDLYDVFRLPDGRTAMLILDVSGHGISAALLTGVVKMSLQRRLVEFADPADAVRAANGDLLTCTALGSFVTACVGTWNPADRTWTYCAAGHPGGIATRGREVTVLPTTGALLGVLTDGEWSSRRITLEPGDRIFLYTDGLTEAGRPDKTIGIGGIIQILREAPAQTLDHMMRLVANDALLACSDAVCDDITLVGFEALEGGRGGQYYVI